MHARTPPFLPRIAGLALALAGALAAADAATARDIFVAPEGAIVPTGAPGVIAPEGAPDGDRARPFPTAQAVFDAGAAQGGDRIVLLDGEHGDIRLGVARATSTVEIAPETPGGVHAQSLYVEQGENLRIRDLSIWPTRPRGAAVPGSLVTTRLRSRRIELVGLDVRSAEDAAGYYAWTLEDWTRMVRNGAHLRGQDITLRDSRFTAVNFGIATLDERAVVENNVVAGFAGDGIRGLGDDSVFRGNTVVDCVKINDNHDDGFQSWSRGEKSRSGAGVVRRVVVERNLIREWAGPAAHPLRCQLQGIGLFDGMYEGWVIRNNVVAVSAFHGIAVLGGIDVAIASNTVVSASGAASRQPWIMLKAHKDGRPSRGGVVANNLTMRMVVESDPADLALESSNVTMGSPARFLVDAADGDFRPAPGGMAIGAADPRYAPEVDFRGVPRNDGRKPTLGAIEP